MIELNICCICGLHTGTIERKTKRGDSYFICESCKAKGG